MLAMRTFVWLIVGFGLYQLAKLLEAFGDAQSYAPAGVSWDRLAYHGSALVVLFAGLACFIRAGILAYRAIRGVNVAQSLQSVFADTAAVEPEKPFDPDAALAHYLETRPSGPTQRHTRPRAPRPIDFGRRS